MVFLFANFSATFAPAAASFLSFPCWNTCFLPKNETPALSFTREKKRMHQCSIVDPNTSVEPSVVCLKVIYIMYTVIWKSLQGTMPQCYSYDFSLILKLPRISHGSLKALPTRSFMSCSVTCLPAKFTLELPAFTTVTVPKIPER